MAKLTILPSQKNAVFEALMEWGLTPSSFDWQEVESKFKKNTVISKLIHRPSGYYFTFDFNQDGHWAEFSPGEEKAVDSEYLRSWSEQFTYLNVWIECLKREVESPDLWAEIAKESKLIEAISKDEENTPFDNEEKEYIRKGIEEIKQYLLTAHKLDTELVESRLNYLVESSTRVGRKDWKNLLLSVLVGIVIAATLPPETTREIFRFVGEVLARIVLQQLLLP